MPRPPAKALFVAALIVLPVQMSALVVALQRASDARAVAHDSYAFAATSLVLLLLVPLVGRVLLSFLPAGLPGAHGPRDLPVTWAASHLLGLFALAAERAFLRDAGLVLLLAPWAVLAGLRLLSLPAAMVPRAEPPPGPLPGPLPWTTRALRWCALPCGIATLTAAADPMPLPIDLFAGAADRTLGPTLPLTTLGWLALWILIDHALWTSRRAPLGRTVALLLLATCAEPLRYVAPGALGMGLGAVFLVPWVRHADRRACVLSAAGFVAPALFGRPMLALIGLVVLVLVSTRAQRKHALASAAACAGIALLAAGFAQAAPGRAASWLSPWSELASAATAGGWIGLWWALPSTLVWATLAFARARRERPAIDDAERELRALWVLVAVLLAYLYPTLDAEGAYQALVVLFPICLLIGGLTWIPTEGRESRA